MLKTITRWTRTMGTLLLAMNASAATYDAAVDFSPTTNPNGVWTYGSTATLGGFFTSYTATSVVAGLDYWGTLPAVFHNPTASPINYATIVVGPGELGLHPGFSGEYSVVRFTAPSAGSYSLLGRFVGVDCCFTTTDVHVILNSVAIFDGGVIGFGTVSQYTNTLALSSGDLVDFAVGYGGNGYFDDSTTLSAILSQIGETTAPEPSMFPVLGLLLLPLWRRCRREAMRNGR